MIVITKYNTNTGEITGNLHTSGVENISCNISEGEEYIEGEFLNTHYKIINGVPQRKSDDEIRLIVNKKAMRSLRRKRQLDLSASDWTQMPDAPLTDEKKQEWATYRQQLRDLPSNTTDPANPTWPTKPT